MKKILAILILCVVCTFCAGSFTACDLSDFKNSVNEIINGQTQDEENNKDDKEDKTEVDNQENNNEENNNENTEEEKTVITKDTDFDALESDKVEKDVFINAVKFFMKNGNPYCAENVNFASDHFGLAAGPFGSPVYNECYITLKIDGLKRFFEAKPIVEQETAIKIAESYVIVAEDFNSYVYCQTMYGYPLQREIHQVNGSLEHDDLTQTAEALWEGAIYNDTTKQYEIASFSHHFLDSEVSSSVHIKIKDGYVVLFEYTNNEGYARYTCYDIGTTVVDIPADILAAMNAAK